MLFSVRKITPHCFLSSFLIFGEEHLIDRNVMIIQLLHLTSQREHSAKSACVTDTQRMGWNACQKLLSWREF